MFGGLGRGAIRVIVKTMWFPFGVPMIQDDSKL